MRVPESAASPAPAVPAGGPDGDQGIDRELLDWWALVMQGFQVTQDSLVGELSRRFNLGRGLADVLLRLLAAPQRRMPMSRLAQEAGMSSGGFTKLADRLCAAGLARRVSCDADRRMTYLELTDEGQDTAQAVSEAVTQVLRTRVVTAIGRDGFGELAEAMRTLRDANGDARRP
ncbi:MarR family winged helix-turn-helix transcriptional regulator [Streptomyces sp. NPDC001978]|uniref:MarR family winged helix-turn-helix transcriptional regulator n=1 Tax=Streptomyces sp. NPDC001978 TaxID=3364627 RepID=UPI0036BF3B99